MFDIIHKLFLTFDPKGFQELTKMFLFLGFLSIEMAFILRVL